MKIMRKILPFLFSLLLPSFLGKLQAETYYQTENPQGDPSLFSLLQAIGIRQNEDGYALYFGQKKIAQTENPLISFETQEQGMHLGGLADVEQWKLSLQVRSAEQSLFQSLVLLYVEDGVQMLDFYPDKDSTRHYVFQMQLLQDGYEQVSVTDRGRNYVFWIDAINNRLEIRVEGNTQSFALESSAVIQAVFLETFVPAHPLSIAYLDKGLPKRSFADARNIPYTYEQIDTAIANEMLTLVHERTGLTYQTPLKQFITFWRRLGKEEYDTSTQETIQEVCQWNEAACDMVRSKYGENGRLYAVYGDTYLYDGIERSEEIVLEEREETLYQNVSWPQNGYRSSDIWPDTAPYRHIQWKQRHREWGEYSAYTERNETDSCYYDENCEYISKPFYRKKTASWSVWSDYAQQALPDCSIYDCQVRSKIFYAVRQKSWSSWSSYAPISCTASSDRECEFRDYYRKRTRSSIFSSWSAWSGYTYDSCTPGLLTQCEKKTYSRTRTASYTSWSDYVYDSCPSGTNTECRSKVLYSLRYRNWSSWSEPVYESCTESETVRCQKVMKYAYRFNGWSVWSAYRDTDTAHPADYHTEVVYRYHNGDLAWKDYPGTSTRIGEGEYYTGNSRVETVWQEVLKEMITLKAREIGLKAEMTQTEIMNVHDEILDNSRYAAVFRQLSTFGNRVSWDDIQQYLNTYPLAYQINAQSVAGRFLNSPLFIAYIYIRPHYRAVIRDMNVGGYDNQQQAFVNSSLSYSTKNLSADLVMTSSPEENDLVVIYTDADSPLSEREELPLNWQEKQELLEEIRRKANEEETIVLHLNKEDIRNLRDWLMHGEETDPCSFWNTFSHLVEKGSYLIEGGC